MTTFIPPVSRRFALAALPAIVTLALGMQVASPAFAQSARAANLAMVGEPPTLDPMASTADVVGTIMQHVYEPLYTFDAAWNIKPMLADGMPKVSADGLTVTIALRSKVKFHNGRDMDSSDVVASLKRWMETAPRGKSVAQETSSLEATGANAIEWKFKSPLGPLLSQLALPTGMAAIMAKESIATPLTSFVGTGPYKFKERKPDQYILLSKFDNYSARTEAASGYAGKREALIDELRFVPVPNANTRVEGALAGQFQYADALPAESISRLDKAGAATVVSVLSASSGFPYIAFNTKEGVMANKGLRQAVQTAMGHGELLAAALGDNRFFKVEANHFPKGSPFYSEVGKELYNQGDARKAKEMAEKAGYKGEVVRILNSRQYEFHHNMALMLAEQLRKAGFKVELDVVDWATLVQRRGDPKLMDMYITHSPVLPEPMLSPPQLGDGAPGRWDTPAKKATLQTFNQEMNPAKRGAMWGKVQGLVYDEVPYVQVGKFSSLAARSPKLVNYQPMTWPAFWNAKLN